MRSNECYEWLNTVGPVVNFSRVNNAAVCGLGTASRMMVNDRDSDDEEDEDKDSSDSEEDLDSPLRIVQTPDKTAAPIISAVEQTSVTEDMEISSSDGGD